MVILLYVLGVALLAVGSILEAVLAFAPLGVVALRFVFH
jgi:hypothetical protein